MTIKSHLRPLTELPNRWALLDVAGAFLHRSRQVATVPVLHLVTSAQYDVKFNQIVVYFSHFSVLSVGYFLSAVNSSSLMTSSAAARTRGPVARDPPVCAQ